MNNDILKEELLHIREDIICGFHSGFPPCCVKFFVTKWVWNLGSKSNREHWRRIRRVRCAKVHYIPCPQCLKDKTFVELKCCPKNCPKVKLVKKTLRKHKKSNGKVFKRRNRRSSKRN